MQIAYIAHAVHAALLLDEEGICRWVVPQAEADAGALRAANRAVGAQFVASLDPSVDGFLHHQPRVGASLLFSATTNGRAALVRFGPLVVFDELKASVAIDGDAEAAELVATSRRESLVPTPRVETPPPPPASEEEPAPSTEASSTGVFQRNEDLDAELLRVVAGLAAELAPVSTGSSDDDDNVRPSGIRHDGVTDFSAETSQFSYAVMGTPRQRADSAWPQPLPRRIG